MRMGGCDGAGGGLLAHTADEMTLPLPSSLRACDVQGWPPAGGNPLSGGEVRLCLWSPILEERLLSPSSLWVVKIKLLFALLEPEV